MANIESARLSTSHGGLNALSASLAQYQAAISNGLSEIASLSRVHSGEYPETHRRNGAPYPYRGLPAGRVAKQGERRLTPFFQQRRHL